MTDRITLENRCDELLTARVKAKEDWCVAYLEYHNLKDRNEDMLHAIMDEVQAKYEKEIPENKLERLARGSEKWKIHRRGLTIAKEKELRARIALDNIRKEQELCLTKFMKS